MEDLSDREVASARRWLADEEYTSDADGYDADGISRLIENYYPGGVAEFKKR